jgi:tape measure domain-containing protein
VTTINLTFRAINQAGSVIAGAIRQNRELGQAAAASGAQAEHATSAATAATRAYTQAVIAQRAAATAAAQAGQQSIIAQRSAAQAQAQAAQQATIAARAAATAQAQAGQQAVIAARAQAQAQALAARAALDAQRQANAAANAAERATAAANRQRSGYGLLAGTINDLRSTLIAFVALDSLVAGAAGAIRLAEDYQTLGARIRIATGGVVESGQAIQQIAAIASATGSSLVETGSLVTSLSRAFQSAGQTASQSFSSATALAQTINQAFSVSGSSAVAAAAATLQLNQALSSGVVRSEELNSVIENSPRLAQALTDALGVTIGQLRAMAENGELTAARVIAALQGQAGTINREFSTIPLTVGRAWESLRTAVTLYLGSANQGSGATLSLASAIKTLADNFGLVVRVTTAIAAPLATYFGLFVVVPGIVTGVTALAARITALGAAAAGSTGATVGLRAALLSLSSVAAGGLVAIVAGYQIGSLMRENSLAVRVFAVELVTQFVLARQTVETAFTGLFFILRAQFDTWLQRSKNGIAELLNTFSNISQTAVGALIVPPELAQGAAELAATLRDTTDFGARLKDDLAGLGQSYQDARGQAIALLGDQRLVVETIDETTRAAVGAAAGVKGIGTAASAAAAQVSQIQQAGEAAANALGALFAELQSENLSAGEQAALRYGQRLAQLSQIEQDLAASGRLTAQAQSDLDQAFQLATQSMQRANAEAAALRGSYDALIAEMEEEADLIGLSSQERARAEAVMRAEAAARQAINQAVAAGNTELDTEAERIAAVNAARELAGQTFDRAAAQVEKDRSYEEWSRKATAAIDGVSDSITQGLFDGFSKGTQSAKDVLKNFFKDIISTYFVKPFIMQIVPSFAGGAGGGAGGFGQILGSIFGGGQSGFAGGAGDGTGGFAGGNPLAGIGSIFGRTISNIGAFFSQGGAFQSGVLGSLGNLGQGFATAGSNILGSGFFGSIGTNIAQGFGSIFSGAIGQGIGQLVPVIGQIAGIASIINKLTKGKLFGTNFSPTGAGGQTINIGPGGASGSIQTEESRRRSFFRGTQTRTLDTAFNAEQSQQITAVFESIQAAVIAATAGFANTVPAIVQGQFREVTDRAGNVIRRVVTVLGTEYDESAEQLQTRITGESIAAAVSAASGEALDALLVQYRTNADSLLDVAGALAQAQTLATSGQALLPDGTLTQTIALVERLRGEGETLSDAFTRAYASAEQLRQVQAQLGLQFGRTGEAFIELAANITQAAGGLDAAQALWSNYYASFYSETERAQAAATAALAARDTALSAIGVDSGITAEAFRAQFERLLPTLTPEQIVSYLQAGAAITAASNASAELARVLGTTTGAASAAAPALGAVGNALAALAAYTDFVQGFADQLLDPLERQRVAVQRELDAALANAERLAQAAGLVGAAAEDIAIIREVFARRLAEIGGGGAAGTGTAPAGFSDGSQPLRGDFRSVGELLESDDVDRWRNALQQGTSALQNWLDALNFSANSILTPAQKYEEALRQFTLAADDDPRLTQLADQLLATGRAYLSSGSAFTALFNNVRNRVQGIVSGIGGGTTQPIVQPPRTQAPPRIVLPQRFQIPGFNFGPLGRPQADPVQLALLRTQRDAPDATADALSPFFDAINPNDALDSLTFFTGSGLGGIGAAIGASGDSTAAGFNALSAINGGGFSAVVESFAAGSAAIVAAIAALGEEPPTPPPPPAAPAGDSGKMGALLAQLVAEVSEFRRQQASESASADRRTDTLIEQQRGAKLALERANLGVRA